MVVFPNAKINIGLDILRKRADGYHDISTVMMPIPWCDVLEIVPSEGMADTLHTSGREVKCAPESNLVMKAVRALRAERDFPNVDIYLHKVIPDGAGLGGGSADAAFTLSALNDMFSLGLDNPQLARIAATLGADCPFFIYNRPMLCEGTGVEMSEFNFRWPEGITLAVVKPDVSVPTKDAYAAVHPHVPARSLPELFGSLCVEEWNGRIKNDFEASVFPLHPVVGEVKDWMLRHGAVYASMSGSGSSVYGLFRDDDIMSDAISAAFPGYDIFVRKL